MRDFLDDLDGRLTAMAQEPEAAHATASRPRRRAGRVRRALLGGGTIGIGAVAAILGTTGTSLAELPILGTPTTDATAIRRQVQAAREAGVDFSKAHAFGTPGGPGYVLVTPERDTVCIALPDQDTPGDYGSSCGTPLAEVERDGLAAELIGDRGDDPDATSVFAFVLPEDAEDVRLASGGREREATVESGVVVAEITAETEVRWAVDGRGARKVFEGPFAASTSVLHSCPDGSTVRLPESTPPAPRADGAPPAPPTRALREAIREACR